MFIQVGFQLRNAIGEQEAQLANALRMTTGSPA
jgi:hypothetical protein